MGENQLGRTFILLAWMYNQIPVQSKECPPKKPLLPIPPASYQLSPASQMAHVSGPGEKMRVTASMGPSPIHWVLH